MSLPSRQRGMSVTGPDAVGRWLADERNRGWLWGSLLVLAVVLVYQPVWYAGYIWDDDLLVTANPSIVGPLGLKEIWTTAAADICPLTLTTFWVEHALWGLAPRPYHVVNVCIHAACAVALWRVLLRLRAPGAWFGSALWALHPVQVESVAWVAELKNVESGLFFLLAILFFVKWLRGESPDKKSDGRGNYFIAFLFAGLAMASKSSTVILPVALCLCAWWMEGRWRWRDMAITLPFFLLSAVASVSSLWFINGRIADIGHSEWQRTWPERLAGAGDAAWFYLGKLIWPQPLAAIYPRWNIDAAAWTSYVPLVAVIAVLIFLWAMRRTALRPCFFVFAYFVVALLPVLGLVENTIFQYSLVFDHFQYLASMGPLALVGAGISELAASKNAAGSRLRWSVTAVMLAVLGMVSWLRVWVYENPRTFWDDALAKNPGAWVGYNDLGIALLNAGQVDEAIAVFRKAVAVNPRNDDGYFDLGNALLKKGHDDEAVASYSKALEINPRSAKAYLNMGSILLKKGKTEQARAIYEKVLQFFPGSVMARTGIAATLTREGQLDQAAAKYEEVLALDVDNSGAHAGLAAIAVKKGRMGEAIAEYGRALKIAPDEADANEGMAEALAQKGRLDEAGAAYRKVLEVDPNRAEAHLGLGLALLKTGRLDEAIVEYQKGLQIDSTNAAAHDDLGSALLQKGRMDEAAIQYQKSLAINPGNGMTHHNLGAIFLQKGELDEAMVEFQKALAIEPNSDLTHFCVGLVYAKKGETENAVAEYRKALAINPGNALARKNLADALAAVPKK